MATDKIKVAVRVRPFNRRGNIRHIKGRAGLYWFRFGAPQGVPPNLRIKVISPEILHFPRRLRDNRTNCSIQ